MLERKVSMSRFLRKDERELVKLLNEKRGMNHRLTPYDFKNPQDVLDALEKATSEYLDMMGIDRGLSDIGLLFEDSVRQHYPEKWLRLGLSGYDGSEPLSTAKRYLDQTEEAFRSLVERAEIKCANLWRPILTGQIKQVHKPLFGKLISYPPAIVEQTLFENLFDIGMEMTDNPPRKGFVIYAFSRQLIDYLEARLARKRGGCKGEL